MTSCEMCGREDKLLVVLVENVEMRLCKSCSDYGKIIGSSEGHIKIKNHQHKEEESSILGIREDYGSIIKSEGEKRGLSQEQLAKKINEKESVIHKIETNHMEPSLDLAKKIERVFKIRLVEDLSVKYKKISTETGSLTIGDLIGNKKRIK